MKKFLKKPLLKYIALAIFAILIISAFFLFQTRTQVRIPAKTSSGTAHWIERIKAVGIAKAYAEFDTSVATLDPGMQHEYAHVFGSAVYSVEGLDGAKDCGTAYSYGCEHAVVAEAITVEGIGAVPTIAADCRKAPYVAMCLHGIGHGFVHAFGYKPDDIMRAMKLCTDSVHDTSVAGCIGGAVMEYQHQTMDGEKAVLKSYDPAQTFEPCASAPASGKPACYFWTVGWWYDVLLATKSNDEIFPALGHLCAALPDSQFTGECFAGIGQNAAMASGYTEKAGDYCDLATASAEDRVFCRGIAANFLVPVPSAKAAASKLCTDMPGTSAARCSYVAHQGVSVFDH